MVIEEGSLVTLVLCNPRTFKDVTHGWNTSSGRLGNVKSDISMEARFVRYFILFGHSSISLDPKSKNIKDLEMFSTTCSSKSDNGFLETESDIILLSPAIAFGNDDNLFPMMSKKIKESSLPLKACSSILSISLLSKTNICTFIPRNTFAGKLFRWLSSRKIVHEPLVGVIRGTDVRFKLLQYTVEELASHRHGGGNGQARQCQERRERTTSATC